MKNRTATILSFVNSFESLGVIGDPVGLHNLHVGDVVVIHYDGMLNTSFVCKENKPYLMGFFDCEADKLLAENKWIKVLDWKNLSDDILNTLYGNTFKISEINIAQMTIEEIEEKLGFKIKIVKGD